MDSTSWLLPTTLHCSRDPLTVGLHRACDGDANLGELCRKHRTGVVPVHVQIIPLVVEAFHKCQNYPRGLAKIVTINQLCFSPIIHTHTPCRYPDLLSERTYAFIPQGWGFPFKYWRNETRPLKEITDSSMATCLSGVCAALNAVQRRSRKGWIFPFLVVLSGSPTYNAPKI